MQLTNDHTNPDISRKLQTSFKPEKFRAGLTVIEWSLKKIVGRHWETLEPVEMVEFTIGWGTKNVWSRGKEELPEDMHGLVTLTDEWHLNGLNAGTKAQTEAIEAWKAAGNRYDYTDACSHLQEIGLFVDNGYKYGYGWLARPLTKVAAAQLDEYLPGFLEAYLTLIK